MVIAQNNLAKISYFETAPCPSETLHSNWVRYPGNTRFDQKTETKIELQNLYMARKGKKNKNRRINAEKEHYILLDTVIKYDWKHKMTLPVPKIK